MYIISSKARSLVALVIGLTFVMVPAGIIYSASFLILDILFPAAGFNQSSHSLGAVAWRIVCCLVCAGVAGYATQMFSRERVPVSLGILAGTSMVCGLMGFHTSNLTRGLALPGTITVSVLLGTIIYASGRIPKGASQATL
jgi:hypothetical protein